MTTDGGSGAPTTGDIDPLAVDTQSDESLRVALGPLRARVDEAIAGALDALEGPAPLPEAMRYSVQAGGKRVRPIMTLAACVACGADVARALDLAVALELVHAYSLVHDDLPSMDNDLLRRGLPTTHVRFGEAFAVLTGDALLTHAFARVAGAEALSPSARVEAVQVLARAAGCAGMVGGQVLDIGATARSLDALLDMHAMKTGALFVAACELGAIAADAPPVAREAAARAGAAIGRAFQLADDLLDAADEGGASGHEAAVNAVAMAGARATVAAAAAAVRDANAALDALPGPTYALRVLAKWTDARARRAGELLGAS